MFSRVRHPLLGDVRVFVPWTWFALVLALAGTTISILWPDDVTGLWVATVVAGIIGIMVSLAAHEISHIIVARRFSQRLRGVSPELLGGLPDTCYHAFAPKTDTFIALAGPIASGLLAIGFGVGWWLAGSPVDSLAVVILILTLFNAAMAVANFMPGYPFDGARVLRAFCWYLTDDLFLATRIVGYFGYFHLLIVFATGAYLISLGGENAVWGSWVLLTGWMLSRSIGRGVTHVYWIETAKRLRVNDVFMGGGNRIDGDLTIQEGVGRLLEMHKEGPVLVFEAGEAVGLMSLQTVRKVRRANWADTRIRDIKLPIASYTRIDVRESMVDLFRLLPYGSHDIVLIERHGRVIGAVDRDLVVQHLREYIVAEKLEDLRHPRRS